MMKISCQINSLTWQAAQHAANVAMQYACERGWNVCVAIVDRGGNLLTLQRMEDAFLQSTDLAIDKAYTAVGFGIPTKQVMDVIRHDEGMKLGFSSRPRLIVFGGGLPIFGQGVLMAGIGVSGASEAQDEECARVGVESLRLSYGR